jgi:GntP family gluconate:H+ symporter
MSWTPHDTALVAWAAASIALVVVLITVFRVHAFVALLLGSLFVGLASGLPASEVISQFQAGFGSTLGSVGILVALGAMLGRLLADSGGADRIVETILAWAGERRLTWAMTLIAMLLGIPLFFEVGVVLLMPVILLMTRRSGMSIVRVGIPALAGLSVMHGFVPPHPGPLIAVAALDADLGHTIAIGLLLAIPTVIVAGPLFGSWVGRRVTPEPPQGLVDQLARPREAPPAGAPGFGLTLATILLPVALMLGRSVADLLLPKSSGARYWVDFFGDPLIALLASVIVAMFNFGYRRGFARKQVEAVLASSLGPIAGIVMIIGAGGGFKQMLIAGGIGTAIGKAAASSAVSPLLLGWLISVGIRLATGSATVATVTASGLMAPILKSLPGAASAPLVALAIGAGSLFFSHVNDAGFWLVKEYFGMTVGETIKTWSTMETILSVVGLVLVLLAGLVVA